MMSKENNTEMDRVKDRMIVLLVTLLKREGSCGAEMRSTIGIVTWDTPMSYLFPCSY